MRILKKRQSKEELLESEIEKRCKGKLCYRTMGYARMKAGIGNKLDSSPLKIEAYKCAFGKHYHIGHHPKTVMDREALRELKTALY